MGIKQYLESRKKKEKIYSSDIEKLQALTKELRREEWFKGMFESSIIFNVFLLPYAQRIAPHHNYASLFAFFFAETMFDIYFRNRHKKAADRLGSEIADMQKRLASTLRKEGEAK